MKTFTFNELKIPGKKKNRKKICLITKEKYVQLREKWIEIELTYL